MRGKNSMRMLQNKIEQNLLSNYMQHSGRNLGCWKNHKQLKPNCVKLSANYQQQRLRWRTVRAPKAWLVEQRQSLPAPPPPVPAGASPQSPQNRSDARSNAACDSTSSMDSDSRDAWDPLFELDVGTPTTSCTKTEKGVFARTYTAGTATLGHAWRRRKARRQAWQESRDPVVSPRSSPSGQRAIWDRAGSHD